MRTRRQAAIGALMATALCATTATAIPIDSPVATLTGPVIDFEGMAEGTLIDTQYAGVVFSQPDGGRPMIDNEPSLFGYDPSSGVGMLVGSTEGGAPFPTVAGIIATFAAPVSAVEAFFSDPFPLGVYTFSAYDIGGGLLESFTIDGTAGGDISGYRGFTRMANDIASVQWGPSDASGDAFAIDDLRFDRRPIPEPGSLAVLGIGLLGLAVARRRRG